MTINNIHNGQMFTLKSNPNLYMKIKLDGKIISDSDDLYLREPAPIILKEEIAVVADYKEINAVRMDGGVCVYIPETEPLDKVFDSVEINCQLVETFRFGEIYD